MILEKLDNGITRWSKIGGIFLAGWFASAAYHGTLTAKKAEEALPAIVAEANCEHRRADKATVLAKQNEIVAPSAIPKDCPHPHVEIAPDLAKPK